MEDEIGSYGRGWAFMRGGGVLEGLPLPAPGGDLQEWVKGYGAALADDDLEGSCPSIELSLSANGVEGEILERLLLAAEAVEQSEGEWFRWPACPVRHSAEAVAARDLRVAVNAGLLDDEV